MSLIYALPQNSPQDCFDLRDALALISRHGRLRVPDGATAVKDYDGGNLYGTSVANLNGGPPVSYTRRQKVASPWERHRVT